MKITEQLIDKTAEKIREQLNNDYTEFDVDMFLNNTGFFYNKDEYIRVHAYELTAIDWDDIVDDFIFTNADDEEQKEHWETMYREQGIDYFLYNNESDENIDLFRDFLKRNHIHDYDYVINRFPGYLDIENDERVDDYRYLEWISDRPIYWDEHKDRIKETINKYNKKVNKP